MPRGLVACLSCALVMGFQLLLGISDLGGKGSLGCFCVPQGLANLVLASFLMLHEGLGT